MDLRLFANPVAKTVIIMAVAAFLGATGDMLLSKGMKEIGDVSVRLALLPQIVSQVLRSRLVLGGAGVLFGFFILWLAVLSWAEFSVALPMTALSYVFGAFLAKYYLGEHLCTTRWLGTALICLGVVLVTKSIR
ncbi:MAG: EamA family transporter [Pseudomonadota bacterium]